MAYSGIGGQAVIEGVMMKNKDRYAVAVRKPDGKIEIQKKPSSSLRDRYKFFDLPIIRGVVTFVESFTMGMGVLNYSASFYEEDEKKDLSAEERKKAEKKESILTGIVMVIAIILAIGIFVLAPFFAMEALKWIPSPELRGFLEGVLRVIIFIVYVKLITLVDDIKRLFMYHGAEHKSINCVENGEDLTVENVMRQSTEHRRCGTSFLLFVMVVSILFFMFIVVGQVWLRMLLRILLIPVIAGLSYELIKFLGSHEGKCVYIISRPGMWLQHLTTREPTEDIVEVAIASVNAVFDWREFQGKPPAEPEDVPETQKESVSGTEAESVPKTEAAEVVESVPEPEDPVTDESFEDVVVEDL